MSVYIKGMEMPDRCFSCPMCDTDCCGISRGSYIEYREVDVDVAMNGRPDWCPLVPVPEHGRLIDADVIIQRIPIPSHEIYENIRLFIESASTIIPASTADKGGEG